MMMRLIRFSVHPLFSDPESSALLNNPKDRAHCLPHSAPMYPTLSSPMTKRCHGDEYRQPVTMVIRILMTRWAPLMKTFIYERGIHYGIGSLTYPFIITMEHMRCSRHVLIIDVTLFICVIMFAENQINEGSKSLY